MRALIVEDDQDVAANVSEYLEPLGYELDFAYDGAQAVSLARGEHFDVIVMDIGLPRQDGVAASAELRKRGVDTPILMLTARDGLEDKAAAFEVGADDYLVKPFELRELEMRLRALRRRGAGQAQLLAVGELSFDTGTRTVIRAGHTLRLNRMQQTALEVLMRAAPNLVTKDALARELWGSDQPGRDALRTLVFELRRTIDRPFGQAMIVTERGQGRDQGREPELRTAVMIAGRRLRFRTTLIIGLLGFCVALVGLTAALMVGAARLAEDAAFRRQLAGLASASPHQAGIHTGPLGAMPAQLRSMLEAQPLGYSEHDSDTLEVQNLQGAAQRRRALRGC